MEALAAALERVAAHALRPARDPRARRAVLARTPRASRCATVIDETIGRARRNAMVRRYNRLLVAFYVVTDALLAMWAFVLAYGIRFESGLIPVTRGYPPLEQYLNVAAVRRAC